MPYLTRLSLCHKLHAYDYEIALIRQHIITFLQLVTFPLCSLLLCRPDLIAHSHVLKVRDFLFDLTLNWSKSEEVLYEPM